MSATSWIRKINSNIRFEFLKEILSFFKIAFKCDIGARRRVIFPLMFHWHNSFLWSHYLFYRSLTRTQILLHRASNFFFTAIIPSPSYERKTWCKQTTSGIRWNLSAKGIFADVLQGFNTRISIEISKVYVHVIPMKNERKYLNKLSLRISI